MRLPLTFFILLYFSLLRGIRGAKILMMPHPFIVSHLRLHYNLANQLLARGHQVTIFRWTATANTASVEPPKGAKVLSYSIEQHNWVDYWIDSVVWKKSSEAYMDYLELMYKGSTLVMKPCRLLQNNPQLVKSLQNEHFDLGVMDPHAYACAWMIMNRIGIPYISLAPSIPVYYVDVASATPTPFSYVPSMVDGFSDKMSWSERLRNIFDHYVFTTSGYWTLIEAWIRGTSDWHKTTHDPVLVMYLTSNLLEHARPYSNTHLNIGLKDRIREHVRDELEDGTRLSNGTIILSLTTLGNKELMPEHMKKAFYDAFSNFPDYRVIWRTLDAPPNRSVVCENDHILYTRWFNQTNLFANPNTRLLITHGGISSVLEAARHGIPMLAMPMGMDHHGNIGRVIKNGIGLRIHKEDISSQKLTQMMRSILTDSKFSERSVGMASMFDDEQSARLKNPLLWWTEYAVRHGSVLKRLKIKGESLLAFRYFNVDLLLSLAFVLLTVKSVL